MLTTTRPNLATTLNNQLAHSQAVEKEFEAYNAKANAEKQKTTTTSTPIVFLPDIFIRNRQQIPQNNRSY